MPGTLWNFSQRSTVLVLSSGWPTGCGKKVSSSQAQLGQATCWAVAKFISISCGPSTPSALYYLILFPVHEIVPARIFSLWAATSGTAASPRLSPPPPPGPPPSTATRAASVSRALSSASQTPGNLLGSRNSELGLAPSWILAMAERRPLKGAPIVVRGVGRSCATWRAGSG